MKIQRKKLHYSERSPLLASSLLGPGTIKAHVSVWVCRPQALPHERFSDSEKAQSIPAFV